MSVNEQLYDLLARRSTEGLSNGDAQALDGLLATSGTFDSDSFDRAAAAVHEALIPRERRLPDALRERLLQASRDFRASDTEMQTPASAAALAPSVGWWVAAAALAIALLGWWPRLAAPPATERAAPTEVTVTNAALRESLAAVAGTVTLPWAVTEDLAATGASGDVVWNNELQQGFMRFSGLAVNDPTAHQYQLWIFDKQRDERYPVDGGVFDMFPGETEVLVPIDPKVGVGEPYLFAVTVEPPGGVVVSTRERIALVAQPI